MVQNWNAIGTRLEICGKFFYDEFRFVLASEVDDDTDESDEDTVDEPLELEVGESYVDRVGGVWEVVHCENEYEYLDDSYDEDDEFYDDGWKFLAVNYDARIHGWFRECGDFIRRSENEFGECLTMNEDLVAKFDG